MFYLWNAPILPSKSHISTLKRVISASNPITSPLKLLSLHFNSPFSLRKAKFKIWKPKNPKNEKRKTSKTEIPKAQTHKKLWRKNSKTNFSCCSPSFSLPLGAFSPMLTPTRLIRWTPLWTLPGFRGTRKPALDKPIIGRGVFRCQII